MCLFSNSQTNIYAPGPPGHESNQMIRLGSDHNIEFHRLGIAINYFMENDPKEMVKDTKNGKRM